VIGSHEINREKYIFILLVLQTIVKSTNKHNNNTKPGYCQEEEAGEIAKTDSRAERQADQSTGTAEQEEC